MNETQARGWGVGRWGGLNLSDRCAVSDRCVDCDTCVVVVRQVCCHCDRCVVVVTGVL